MIYCSAKCQFQPRRLGQMLRCSNPECDVAFYRMRKEMRKVGKSYCSSSCSAVMNNRDRPKRIRASHTCANASCGENIPMHLVYCSRKCFNLIRTTYTSDELIKLLKDASERLKRTPAKREMHSVAEMCIRAFGSWNAALLAAGLAPHRSHSQRMYRRMNTIAFDGHRCDSISEALVDNWLTKNNIAHERNVPYPGTGHKADWSVGKKVFIEYFGLANDSIRYDRVIKEKRKLCKKHNIRLIEIYAKDLYPVVKLDGTFHHVLSRAVV